MRISSRLVYQIVSFSPAAMRVCKFRKHGQKFRIVSWNTVPCEAGGESVALRKVLEENGGQISGCMILTGAMESGTFFTCPGAPLNVRAQKNALEFELPLHMLQVPQESVIQFARFRTGAAEDESDTLNVYAFDSVAINHLASLLTIARVKADEFIYPLLGIQHDDPPVCLSEIESGFCWQNGEWTPYHGNAEECNRQWKPVLEKSFDFPVGKEFPFSDYIACLLVMRFIMAKTFQNNEPSVRIMPPKLRPSRCRSQVIVMAFLLLVLGIGWGIRAGVPAYQGLLARRNQYNVLSKERDAIKSEINTLNKEVKAGEKLKKELEKTASITAGDPELFTKLYDLSLSLPEDALVTNFRFTDSNCTLTIQTQNRNIDITQRMNFPYWRIATVQQRVISDTIATINMNLVKAEEAQQ